MPMENPNRLEVEAGKFKKKLYVAPSLVEYGDVNKLTQDADPAIILSVTLITT
ncbi:lasso RiPP family leader peptide-containing protein [Acidipila sp. EB88]|uniref:lasso RiPP family leader peptide-containing protein n=1 Tax=Acidipila sp. EB88 TaxID=2305226 RepID=UPI000F5FEC29|nr:lasso RiPP family leader peptide-containing protein [Acidipila sp. EB88]